MIEPITPHDPAPSATTYVVVWIALVVLATITLLIFRAPIGNWSIVVALVIATTKAVLVLAYFMHLAHGRPLHKIIFSVAVGFFILLVIGIVADVGTRIVASPYVDAPETPAAIRR